MILKFIDYLTYPAKERITKLLAKIQKGTLTAFETLVGKDMRPENGTKL